MADDQRVHLRRPRETFSEIQMSDLEHSQNPTDKETLIPYTEITCATKQGDPFPEDPLIPHEEHTFTVYGRLFLFLLIISGSLITFSSQSGYHRGNCSG